MDYSSQQEEMKRALEAQDSQAQNWRGHYRPEMPVSNLGTVEGSLRSADEDKARRAAYDAADTAYGRYLYDLIKYKNEWERKANAGVPTWALSRLLSPPKPVSQEQQLLLGLPLHSR